MINDLAGQVDMFALDLNIDQLKQILDFLKKTEERLCEYKHQLDNLLHDGNKFQKNVSNFQDAIKKYEEELSAVLVKKKALEEKIAEMEKL